MRPRLTVFISNKHIWAQIIDDQKGHTLVSANDKEVGGGKTVDVAYKVGALLAKKAVAKKITKVVFDRGRYKYHGRVRSLADAARKGGLIF
jgi:large subunit ribosomal protein L18